MEVTIGKEEAGIVTENLLKDHHESTELKKKNAPHSTSCSV